tara:strand:+ start:609 stop:788 length:180 start_codon:yes stop_codon:yes gene_type:complete
MQFTRNTSSSRRTTGVILKIGLLLVLFTVAIFILSRVDFPAPKKEIEKIIPNENFKIVK